MIDALVQIAQVAALLGIWSQLSELNRKIPDTGKEDDDT